MQSKTIKVRVTAAMIKKGQAPGGRLYGCPIYLAFNAAGYNGWVGREVFHGESGLIFYFPENVKRFIRKADAIRPSTRGLRPFTFTATRIA